MSRRFSNASSRQVQDFDIWFAFKEVKTRAEMRLGELTAKMPKAQGARTDLTSPTKAEKSETKYEALNRVQILQQSILQVVQFLFAHVVHVSAFYERKKMKAAPMQTLAFCIEMFKQSIQT